MGADPDWQAVRANIRRMSREELVEELALRREDWAPQALLLLEEEARARGIAAADVTARRTSAAREAKALQIDFPALLVTCQEKADAAALARALRERGVPALVREMEGSSCGCGGKPMGRWGLIVPGERVREAALALDDLVPREQEGRGEQACGSCGHDPGESQEPFAEDGEWWRADPGVPLEGDERDR